jgi:ferredoxin
MIITEKKNFNQLLQSINKKPVFIIGCSECATLCNTGGEKEVKEMKEKLLNNEIEVTGWVVLEPACHLNNDKRILKKYKENISKAEKILVLACGNGAQTVSEIIYYKDVLPGTNTLFLGEIKRLDEFEKRCEMCGECIQDLFDGFCPVSRCPKAILNGPCGGSSNGKCEINKDMDCVWILIIEKLKKKGRLDLLNKIQEPKKWSKGNTYYKKKKNEI